MEQSWRELKVDLRNCLSSGQYDLWVATIEPLEFKEKTLILGCRNRLHMEWLRDKLEKQILEKGLHFFSGLERVEYVIVEESPLGQSAEVEDVPVQSSFSELISRPGLKFNPRFTFDQFVVGKSNHFAYAASMALAEREPRLSSQPVFLLSESGLGKSHLSHAVGNHLVATKPDLRVRYVTAEQFANEMISSLRNDSIESFKRKYRATCDILLMESVEFFSGKEKIQKELVFTLDELRDRGKQIVCTGRVYPRDIPKLSSELRSRLSGVLVAPISRPDFDTRVNIIRKKAKTEQSALPGEVVDYLADQITGDIRQLESCVVGLITKSSILGVPVSLHMAQEVAQTVIDQVEQLTIDRIQQIVSTMFQISVEDLRSPSRRKELATARKIAMYLCREYTSETTTVIGKAFSRSHSAVLHAIKVLKAEMKQTDGKAKRQVEFITRRLESGCLR